MLFVGGNPGKISERKKPFSVIYKHVKEMEGRRKLKVGEDRFYIYQDVLIENREKCFDLNSRSN